jgi:hypothetical protein
LLAVLPLSMAPDATAGGAASNTDFGREHLDACLPPHVVTPPEERTGANSTLAGLTVGLSQ